MVDQDTIAMLCPTNLMILTRPCLQDIKPKSPTRRKTLDGSKNEPEEKPKLSDNKFHEFIHTGTLMLNYDAFKRKPIMVKYYKSPFILVSFDDGHVQLIQHSEELFYRDRNIPRPIGALGMTLLMSDFGTSHTIPSGLSEKEKPLPLKLIFDANICDTYGSNGYLQEIYTVGYDLKIKHWGLRYAVNPDFASFEVQSSHSQESKTGLEDEEGKESNPTSPKEDEEINNSPTSVDSKKVYTEEIISPYPDGYIVAADNLGVSNILFSCILLMI
jgi:hypothetical protein